MTQTSFIDPEALMRVKSLELRAKMVMEGFWKGLHKSPFHGFSVEFSEYRPYTKGDDPRFLDWKVMARNDRAYIKKFEDETNLYAHLVVDRSRSMEYGSESVTKADYAATLAATLAYFLMGQQDAVGLTTFDEKIDQHIPPRNRPGQLRHLMLQLEQAPAGHGTNLESALKGLHDVIRKRSLILFVSDFLAPIESLEQELGYLVSGKHELALFQILDPREFDFDFSQAALYRDAETEQDLFVDPSLVQQGYRERFGAHQGAIQTICSRHGIHHQLISTAEPLEKALFEFVSKKRG